MRSLQYAVGVEAALVARCTELFFIDVSHQCVGRVKTVHATILSLTREEPRQSSCNVLAEEPLDDDEPCGITLEPCSVRIERPLTEKTRINPLAKKIGLQHGRI